jgi:plasmid stabilization system protein ParE
MKIQWSDKALSDLQRLFEFLAPVNRQAAAKRIRALTAAPIKLIDQPRIGERIATYDPREVRRFLVGHYEIRY